MWRCQNVIYLQIVITKVVLLSFFINRNVVMVKRKVTIATLSFLSALSVNADDKVTVVTVSGETPYEMESISKIDFSDAGLTVVSKGESGVTYAFDEIKKIVFSNTSTGIEPMTAVQKSKLSLTVDNAGLSVFVNGWGNRGSARLVVYSMSGGTEVNIGEWNGTKVDVSSLPHGIYILKVGNEAVKFKK